MPSADRRELTIGYVTPASPLAWPHPREGPATLDATMRPAARTLIGGVGYTNLRDRSFGPLLVERLLARAWPSDVVVEDLSYGPIDVLFKLQAEGRPFRLGVFAGAVARGRTPGTVERYIWSSSTPAADDLQERIGEALTGVVSLDNLLYILDHFGALPERTVVIEVEPEADEGWGAELSPPVAAAFETVERLILDALATSSSGVDQDWVTGQSHPETTQCHPETTQCHPERSEGSHADLPGGEHEILRCAQDDILGSPRHGSEGPAAPTVDRSGR